MKSKNAEVFAILRTDAKESIIVLVNMGREPIDNYELSLDESIIGSGEKQIIPLLGTSEKTTLTIDRAGGFSGFKPMDEIPPYDTSILLLSNLE